MANVTYKKHVIIPVPWKLHGGMWQPRVVIFENGPGGVNVKKLSAKPSTVLDTKGLADSYSVKMAKKWIDDQG